MRIFAFAVLMLGAVPKTSRPSGVQDDRAGVEAFNKAFDAATRRMDTPATLALWDDDGVSLMPSARPVVGKPAIAAFMAGVVKDLTGAHMQSFTNQCFDIAVSGDWASEWCVEHQVVRFASGKMFDGWGKLLLVLHRGGDGRWKLREEMWNQGTAADSTLTAGYLTTSNAVDGTRENAARSASLQRGSGAPLKYHALPLSASSMP
jgi:ketosteroid isomerase-like protein